MLMQTHEARLSALRAALAEAGLHGFVVPICDEHMSEYVGSYAQRLEWLTGFGGSAGTAVVLANEAAIFIDGRYTIQVRQQVDERLFAPVGIAEQSVLAWIAAHAPQGARIGFDPWLHGPDWVKQLQAALVAKGGEAVAVTSNPIDTIWADQPMRSDAKLAVHTLEHAGENSADKRARIAQWMTGKGLDATVITALDSVAWLFNIRGADIDRTPVPLSFALVRKDGSADLFVSPGKMTAEVRAHLGNDVGTKDYTEFLSALDDLAGQKVGVDPERAVQAIFARLEAAGADIVCLRDPAVLMKAQKNATEINGHRAAQARDGAALSGFLHWLSKAGPAGGQTELSAAAKLQEFREATGVLKDLSFDTISGAASNGAICHYRVSEETNLPIETGTLYLVDSGGQYLDGTTDVTRTIAIGAPTQEMRRRFTQVLKGHIALARAVFPVGTTGGQLDILARQFLWADGVDYAHGTGHGVGSYLAVHEGPARIASFGGMNEALRPGMILSNEPGYYKDNAFGIRIENLILVEQREIAGAERQMLGFETLTFAPIDRVLIDTALLSAEERGWMDAYHAKVRDIVGPQLSGEALAWLEQATAPLD